MSVYIVSSATINAIVHAAKTHGLCVLGGTNYLTNLQELGQTLANMNFASYEYRYGIRKEDKYTYKFRDATYTPAEMLGSCHCYEYQACEAPDYYDSGIPEWLNALCKAIGDREAIEAEYGKLPWGL